MRVLDSHKVPCVWTLSPWRWTRGSSLILQIAERMKCPSNWQERPRVSSKILILFLEKRTTIIWMPTDTSYCCTSVDSQIEFISKLCFHVNSLIKCLNISVGNHILAAQSSFRERQSTLWQLSLSDSAPKMFTPSWRSRRDRRLDRQAWVRRCTDEIHVSMLFNSRWQACCSRQDLATYPRNIYHVSHNGESLNAPWQPVLLYQIPQPTSQL